MKAAKGSLKTACETRLLDRVNLPEDLRGMSMCDLPVLAGEIREMIVDTVTENGGHLASNLGVVELTLALHRVFDFSRHRLIWDVGHQCYPHKILTGRKIAFHTLRQHGGIGGFPRRSESVFDVFGTGHSSTSISAACGFAAAERLQRSGVLTVAVIGDGALSGGMAWEALNHAADINGKLLIILNDNGFSISPNTGAVARILKTGDPSLFFSQFGFRYSGPVDGHDIRQLTKTLTSLSLDAPVFLHVKTEKGRGWSPAMSDPSRFHGVGPAPGRKIPRSRQVSFTETFGETVSEIADRDRRVVVVTAGMRAGTGLMKFCRRHPDRFYDPGITEQHAVTFAAGMAAQGFRPVVAIYSTFFQRAYDQIVHDVCLQNLPVVFALDRAGFTGADGATHHGLFDMAFLRCVPGLTIMAPKDPDELRQMMITAIAMNRPVAIRYPKLAVPVSGIPAPAVESGKAEVLRHGTDMAILAVGAMVQTALDVSDLMAEMGVACGVVNARFVKPLDASVVQDLGRRMKCLITLEEHTVNGGFGSAVLECLHQARISCPVMNMGVRDTFVSHGSRDHLLEECGLTPMGIFRAIMNSFQASRSWGDGFSAFDRVAGHGQV